MKVFEFKLNGESYTVAAKTLLFAIQIMIASDELLIKEIYGDDAVEEIPQEKWGEIKIKDVDTGELVSITELIKGEEPQILGSTIYEM